MSQEDLPPLTPSAKEKTQVLKSYHQMDLHRVPEVPAGFFRRSKKPDEEPGFYTYDDTPTSIYRSEDPPPYELSNGEKYIAPFNPSWVSESSS